MALDVTVKKTKPSCRDCHLQYISTNLFGFILKIPSKFPGEGTFDLGAKAQELLPQKKNNQEKASKCTCTRLQVQLDGKGLEQAWAYPKFSARAGFFDKTRVVGLDWKCLS